MKEVLKEPPKFSEEILRKALHYTDLPDNPTYDAFKSESLFEIHSGAKGVSKSFGGALITIYRIVNDIRFNSIWCRNRYKHIKTTLRPMFEKVLDLLKRNFDLDYRPYFRFYEERIFWDYEDGGKGRGIYFANWENVQSFQGLTLPNQSFCWGEIVVDEPIEDPSANHSVSDLRNIYEAQEDNLQVILQNTVFRVAPPKDFIIKIKFFYNIFYHNHFLITTFHNRVIIFCDDLGNPKEEVLNELSSKKFLQIDNKEEFDGLGIVVTMYSKEFVPEAELSTYQRKNLEQLKKTNLRLWTITVAGLSFQKDSLLENYYLKKLIYQNDGQFNENIHLIEPEQIYEDIKNGLLQGVYYGYDPGRFDNASLVCFLHFKSYLLYFKGFEDIKELIKTNNKIPTLKQIHMKLLDLIKETDNEIIDLLEQSTTFNYDFNAFNYSSFLDLDNDTETQVLRERIFNQNWNILINKAKRRKLKNVDYSIIGRQQKWQFLLSFSHIKFINNFSSRNLLKKLSMQVIDRGEEKRNEKINPEIYDLINASEYAINRAWPMLIAEIEGV